jgi:hypothetical protein
MRPRNILITACVIALAAAYITAYFPAQDFAVYYTAGNSLLQGRTDLYSPDFANGPLMDYRYPPGFLLLFVPFVLLPANAAVFCWAVLTLSLLVLAFLLYKSVFSETLDSDRTKLLFFLAALLSLKYVLIALKYQNVHLIVLSLFVIALCLWIKGKLLPAAALMALAISIKVFPVLAMPYFLIKRQWKFAAMTGAILAILVILPSFFFGVSGNIDLHRQWFSHVITPSAYHVTNGPVDLSVQGQVRRYFSEVNYAERENDRDYRNINLTSFEPAQVGAAGLVSAALIFAATFGVILFHSRNRAIGPINTRFVFHELGLVICMMVLVGPRTNIIYMSAIFLPITVLLYSWKTRRSWVPAAALVVVFIASVVLPLIPGAKTQRLFLVFGTDFFAVLAVWIALLWMLIGHRRLVIPLSDDKAHLP